MLRLLKIVVLLVLGTAAIEAMASRDIRSPGGSGWQGSSGFGGRPSSIGVARSSTSGWSGFGSGEGQADYGARSGGWNGKNGFGSGGRSGWASGRSSSAGYGGNTYSSNGGWASGSTDWADSGRSFNSWDDSRLGARSNNGWQSSVW